MKPPWEFFSRARVITMSFEVISYIIIAMFVNCFKPNKLILPPPLRQFRQFSFFMRLFCHGFINTNIAWQMCFQSTFRWFALAFIAQFTSNPSKLWHSFTILCIRVSGQGGGCKCLHPLDSCPTPKVLDIVWNSLGGMILDQRLDVTNHFRQVEARFCAVA